MEREKKLERMHSTRRAAADVSDAGADDDDESKTKKPIPFTTRASNYISRNGLIWPCLTLSLILALSTSTAVFYSRSLVCDSSSPITRSRFSFFGFDGLDSDFGSLGRSKHGKTVEWTSKDLLRGLEEFVPIYETRPIKNNMYGMGFDHSFGLWFIARWLKPELMIESGAFKGHSTWVLRQAMPESRIISVTPRHPEKYLKKGPAYVDENCTYFAGGGHSCFKDSDEARVRANRRKFWEKAVDIDELCGPGEAWWGVKGETRDDFNHSNKAISIAEHFKNSRFLESILDIYWELPPVAGPSLTHQTRYDPARSTSPIVEDGRYRLFQRLGLTRLDASVFNGYTQMVYVQISMP
ncbi:hypothetical protein V2J09_005487 [Rumex salicifolius]